MLISNNLQPMRNTYRQSRSGMDYRNPASMNGVGLVIHGTLNARIQTGMTSLHAI